MTNGTSEGNGIIPSNMGLLIEAIIIQAVKDYRQSKNKLKRYSKKKKLADQMGVKLTEQEKCEISKCKATMDEVKRFLLSEYFYSLTDVSGEAILKRLEGKDNEKKRNRSIGKRN